MCNTCVLCKNNVLKLSICKVKLDKKFPILLDIYVKGNLNWNSRTCNNTEPKTK